VHTLPVQLGDRAYEIRIGSGLLAEPNALDAAVGAARDLLLVSNTIVMPLYGDVVRRALAQRSDRRIVEVVLPDGESHKTLGTLSRILDVLVANRFGRDACVLALGGGVVGDVAGFAAAAYQRGVDFVQLPTTLLAQVDSSVGGKTGVNHPGGKNLIGAFHQPRAVLADTNTLGTLPVRELRAGLAEVIKYGLICDAPFFAWLEQSIEPLLACEPEVLGTAIRRCCEIKAAIVARDERETGDRALLNLGHTFGHAIEAATQYGTWLHGEAVGAGLVMAATMSRHAGLLASDEVARIERLLERVGLPTRAADVTGAAAMDAMRIDKKAKSGRVRFVLLRRIGEAFLTADYPPDALQATLAARFA
jgi:3-dehydroquinate synthase